VEQEEVALVRQRRSKNVSAATNKHATIHKLLEAMFSVRSLPRLYGKDQQQQSSHKN
jgi:ribosome-interacting GTPase 1